MVQPKAFSSANLAFTWLHFIVLPISRVQMSWFCLGFLSAKPPESNKGTVLTSLSP